MRHEFIDDVSVLARRLPAAKALVQDVLSPRVEFAILGVLLDPTRYLGEITRRLAEDHESKGMRDADTVEPSRKPGAVPIREHGLVA